MSWRNAPTHGLNDMLQSNRFELTGYLAGACSHRVLPSRTPVANGRLGQMSEYRTKDAATRHTNWFGLVFYAELAAVAMTYQTGDNLHIIGTMQQRQFTPKDGSTRCVYEVIVQKCHRIAPSGTENPTAVHLFAQQPLRLKDEENTAFPIEDECLGRAIRK
jgi:single-strand DNA-binding protein